MVDDGDNRAGSDGQRFAVAEIRDGDGACGPARVATAAGGGKHQGKGEQNPAYPSHGCSGRDDELAGHLRVIAANEGVGAFGIWSIERELLTLSE